MALEVPVLLDYTRWEREKWHKRLLSEGDHVLDISVGAHGDGRFSTIGDLVLHIFSAEKRYGERLTWRPLSQAPPLKTVAEVFDFGKTTRAEFEWTISEITEWDVAREFKILDYSIQASPRKIVQHVLLHEIRHWAQVATLLRLNGVKDDFHDFLFFPE